jgi:hypothetical protein
MSERCIWSNEQDEGTRPITLRTRGRPPREEIVNVCQAHEAAVRRIHVRSQRFGAVLLASFGVSVVVIIGSTLAGVGAGIGLGVILFGIAILVLPFPTPQTVEAVGMRKAIWVARGIGVLIIGFGLGELFEVL